MSWLQISKAFRHHLLVTGAVFEFLIGFEDVQHLVRLRLLAHGIRRFVGLPIRFRRNLRRSLVGDAKPLVSPIGLAIQCDPRINASFLLRLLAIDTAQKEVGLAGRFTAEHFVADDLKSEFLGIFEATEANQGFDLPKRGFLETGRAGIGLEGGFENLQRLIRFLDHAVDQGFLKPKHRSLLIVEEEPERLLDRFEEFIAARTPKRFERSKT